MYPARVKKRRKQLLLEEKGLNDKRRHQHQSIMNSSNTLHPSLPSHPSHLIMHH